MVVLIIIVLFFLVVYYILLLGNIMTDGYSYERNLPKLRFMFIPFYYWVHKFREGIVKYRDHRGE